MNADDIEFDERVVAQVDASIWRAIRAGHFRLAVKCRGCGRWLLNPDSKLAHLGPDCAAKAVDK